MISYQEALTIIKSAIKSYGSETVALADAFGRSLAENIYADRDYPPFNRSAMDGFAFHSKDWEKGLRSFTIQEIIYAGQEWQNPLSPGKCYKIMTGAAVPPSANVVVRREDTEEISNKAIIRTDLVREFQNIARQGEDVEKDALIVKAPCKCTASVISALATIGKAEVLVHKIPQVALYTTGDEVVDPTEEVSAVQIRNSNKYLLYSLLQKWGITPSIVKHLPDNKEALEAALKAGISQDIVLLCGGVSAGDADFVPEILSGLGVQKLFHKVAIRPGKPIWCGRLPNGGIVFALPGNPFSCLVTFSVFVEAYLNIVFHKKERPLQKQWLNQDHAKKHRLTEFLPVKFGLSGVVPMKYNGSGDIRAGLDADGLVIHPSSSNLLPAGDSVDFVPFVF